MKLCNIVYSLIWQIKWGRSARPCRKRNKPVSRSIPRGLGLCRLGPRSQAQAWRLDTLQSCSSFSKYQITVMCVCARRPARVQQSFSEIECVSFWLSCEIFQTLDHCIDVLHCFKWTADLQAMSGRSCNRARSTNETSHWKLHWIMFWRSACALRQLYKHSHSCKQVDFVFLLEKMTEWDSAVDLGNRFLFFVFISFFLLLFFLSLGKWLWITWSTFRVFTTFLIWSCSKLNACAFSNLFLIPHYQHGRPGPSALYITWFL